MRAGRRRVVGALGLTATAVLVATSCGTTVPYRSTVAAGGNPVIDQGLGSTPAVAATGGIGAPSATSAAPPPNPAAGGLSPSEPLSGTLDVAPSDSAAVAPSATRPTSAAPLSVRSGANGPGIAPSTIDIGLMYASNTASGNAALGATVSSTDAKADAQAYVDYLNAHGGIGGRRVQLDGFDIASKASTETISQIATDVCTYFTQDKHVFAMLYEVLAISAQTQLNSCLAKGGVLPLGAATASLGDADFAAVPTYVDTVTYPAQGAMRNLVDALAKLGYLTTRWDPNTGASGGTMPVRVGIIYPDVPSWSDAVNHVLLPALAAQHIQVAPSDIVSVTFPSSTADNGTLVSQVQAAVLRMRADNVTHLIPVELNTFSFFAASADPQGYRPRYGLTSATETAEGVRSGIVPARQIVGAAGVGWLPALDLSDPSHYAPPGRAACLAVMNAAGLTFSDPFAETSPLSQCDQLGLLKKAIGALGAQPVTAVAVADAIDHVGSAFPYAETVGGSLTPAHHYATTQGWLYTYSAPCSCMTYSSTAFTLR